MFAVPGWNLSAPLKVQTEAAPAPGAAAATAPSKKRKRGRDKKTGANAAPLVTEDNVADMYARHIDGLKPAARPKVQAQEKPKAKEAKPEDNKGKLKDQKQRRESAGGKGEDDKAKAPRKQQQQQEKEADKGDDTAAPPKAKKQKKDTTATVAAPSAPPPAPLPAATKLTPLQAKMREKLAAARFRHLNETLYTTPSAHAAQLVASDPSVFAEYHAGFRQQVAVWPENPVDGFVALVRARAKVRENWRDRRNRKGGAKKGPDDGSDSDGPAPPTPAALKPLPRTHGTCTLADLGCGDAALATQLTPQAGKFHLKLHSFDLASPSPLVTTADIANLPLASNSVDVALFCLALMGTNWLDFIDEAYRILRWRGELWVAEIKSRFGRSAHQGGHKPGEAVAHSVGKRQKKKAAAAASSKAGKQAAAAADSAANDAAQAAAEAELDGDLGGAVPTPAGQETDVSAFVAALRRRGFVLDAPVERPQDAVDLGNKMFVRMRFVKGLPALRGKNAGLDADGKPVLQQGMRKPGRFTAVKEDEEADDEADARVLKPCVYKLR